MNDTDIKKSKSTHVKVISACVLELRFSLTLLKGCLVLFPLRVGLVLQDLRRALNTEIALPRWMVTDNWINLSCRKVSRGESKLTGSSWEGRRVPSKASASGPIPPMVSQINGTRVDSRLRDMSWYFSFLCLAALVVVERGLEFVETYESAMGWRTDTSTK